MCTNAKPPERVTAEAARRGRDIRIPTSFRRGKGVFFSFFEPISIFFKKNVGNKEEISIEGRISITRKRKNRNMPNSRAIGKRGNHSG
ncbi:hypothetical protein DLM86_21130 [Paenibacillus flagellatus]|uniref:Uncharacterized protein n=1 Tax=Paenibacillus flagellatus TaxID=2211139 RepID=A0A2V5K202_9BACL|nr:hypothetical protein DLM86_21130 [Paenibacillus flagellatus]